MSTENTQWSVRQEMTTICSVNRGIILSQHDVISVQVTACLLPVLNPIVTVFN